MENVHRFPVSRRNARRGVAVAAIVAAAVVVLCAASLVSFGDFSTPAMGEANANARAHALVDPARAKPTEPQQGDSATARDFDYFPSHYRNQATEPAEPIATF